MKKNYQEVQETSQEEIKIIGNKIKNAIEYAKPFYEARKQASELMKNLKSEQTNYERARTNLAAAKEMVALAEQSVTQVRTTRSLRSLNTNCEPNINQFQNSKGTVGLDIALQEMISHATSRVNQYTDECNK